MPGQPPLTTLTSTYLLMGLAEAGNQTVWRHYVDRYRPVLVSYARRLGAPETAAEDIAQETLAAFAAAYREGAYRRDRGRLRQWLFGIARNQVVNWRRRHDREVQVDRGTDQTDFFDRIGDESQLEAIWEQEWQEAVVGLCLRHVQGEVEPATYQAFELFACRGWPARQVGSVLGMSENAVFSARRRVLHRIRELRSIIDDV
jgi:RNA polymerase sigma-70 factor (ECF subfamily)